MDDYCARRGRTVDACDKGVDKMIYQESKGCMQYGTRIKNNNSGQLV
jgi:hypothetical protein